jgi:hypothetical protein
MAETSREPSTGHGRRQPRPGTPIRVPGQLGVSGGRDGGSAGARGAQRAAVVDVPTTPDARSPRTPRPARGPASRSDPSDAFVNRLSVPRPGPDPAEPASADDRWTDPQTCFSRLDDGRRTVGDLQLGEDVRDVVAHRLETE